MKNCAPIQEEWWNEDLFGQIGTENVYHKRLALTEFWKGILWDNASQTLTCIQITQGLY